MHWVIIGSSGAEKCRDSPIEAPFLAIILPEWTQSLQIGGFRKLIGIPVGTISLPVK